MGKRKRDNARKALIFMTCSTFAVLTFFGQEYNVKEELTGLGTEPEQLQMEAKYADAECCGKTIDEKTVKIIPQEIVEVTNVGTCKITFYCPCEMCNGNADKIAGDGSPLQPFLTCAVDPEVIPLGSDVYIDFGENNVQVLRASDTGSAISGGR